MNERIKELAWSIGIAGKNLQGQIDTDWNQIEKFAELLIKECAKSMWSAYSEDHKPGIGLARLCRDFEIDSSDMFNFVHGIKKDVLKK